MPPTIMARGNGGRGDRQRVLRGDDDARENASAKGVGAEDEQPAALHIEGRRVSLLQVHLGRDVTEQAWSEESAKDHQQEKEGGDERELVPPK